MILVNFILKTLCKVCWKGWYNKKRLRPFLICYPFKQLSKEDKNKHHQKKQPCKNDLRAACHGGRAF